jgi:putative hydrolase of the HAD superfamily
MASVQRNKISALSLGRFLDVVLCTDELGKDCWKPSTAPFQVALEMLQTDAAEAIYVADDISKDFFGPNTIGMVTVQLTRPGIEKPDLHNLPEAFKPRYIVSNLEDIVSFLGDNPHV